MKKLITVLSILLSSLLVSAQCQKINCTGKANIAMSEYVSSNTVGDACYLGSGNLFEYSTSSWKERSFIGYIRIQHMNEMPDSATIQSQVLVIFDTLIMNSYDTLIISGIAQIKYLQTNGTGNYIIFENPTDFIVDSAMNKFFSGSTFRGVQTALCRRDQITGIRDLKKERSKNCTRPGVYDLTGRKLNEEPRGVNYIKDCVLQPAKF